MTNQSSSDEQPPVASDSTSEVPLNSVSGVAPANLSVDSVEPSVEPPPLVPKRPLMRPVSRPEPPPVQPVVPQKPAAISVPPQPDLATEEVSSETSGLTEDESLAEQAISRHRPIPPPSEPKQYRAIGLVRGRYVPSEEQFTRGTMVTADGAEIEAVLLGRVMSLVRNHLDLEQDHLWVVYPRTREAQENLHVQIVGVWEPEKLQKSSDDAEDVVEHPTETVSDEEPLSPGFEDDYFSIRGEVVFYSPDDSNVVVKIQQAARKSSDKAKAFKLKLDGTLPSSKTVGYFWDLQVKRLGVALVITEGTAIGLVPPKKKSKTDFKQDRRPQKNFRGPRPATGGKGAPPKPPAGASGAPRREPPPKPVKRTEQSKED
ncbi:MAG: hypothetical protein WCA35_18355 [Kovacikia sp.]